MILEKSTSILERPEVWPNIMSQNMCWIRNKCNYGDSFGLIVAIKTLKFYSTKTFSFHEKLHEIYYFLQVAN